MEYLGKTVYLLSNPRTEVESLMKEPTEGGRWQARSKLRRTGRRATGTLVSQGAGLPGRPMGDDGWLKSYFEEGLPSRLMMRVKELVQSVGRPTRSSSSVDTGPACAQCG